MLSRVDFLGVIAPQAGKEGVPEIAGLREGSSGAQSSLGSSALLPSNSATWCSSRLLTGKSEDLSYAVRVAISRCLLHVN